MAEPGRDNVWGGVPSRSLDQVHDSIRPGLRQAMGTSLEQLSFTGGTQNAGAPAMRQLGSYGAPAPVVIQPDPMLQQRLFGVLNEAGTNVSRVPIGLTLPGQSYAFQHARFAISGSQLAQAMAQHAAGNLPFVGNMLNNHPEVMPIYRPDLSVAGLNPSSMKLPNAILQSSSSPFSVHQPGGMSNWASVIAQPMPRNNNQMFFPRGMGSPNASGGLSMMTGSAGPYQPPSSYPMGQGSLAAATMYPAQTVHVESPRNFDKRDRVATEEGAKKKRRRRDPSLPTPARFAWNFFFRDQYTKIRNAEPSEHSNVQKAFTDIGLDLGKKWKGLSKEEKAPYIKLAQQDRERYEREMRERFAGGKEGASAAASSSGKDDDEDAEFEQDEDDDEQEHPEKMGIVLHEIEVEDTRKGAERNEPATEGELVADVLVVDDDEVFLKIIRHKLVVGQKNPPRIVTVTNAEEATRMIVDEKKKFGTILLDKNFGDGHTDGIASLKCIRENGYSGVIVGVTVSEDAGTREEFAKSGADNTFVKGSSRFYDEMVALIKLHSTNAELLEKAEANDKAPDSPSSLEKPADGATGAV